MEREDEMKTNKKKMSNSKFRKIWTAICAVLLILCIIVNVGMNMFSAVLDSYLGRGRLHVEAAEGTGDWNTEYYSKSTDSLEEAKAASDEISEQVTDEGIVLLKNNGVLPLAKSSQVTPFGYAYLNPAYSGIGAAATTDNEMVTVEQGLGNYFDLNTAAIDKMKSAKAGYPGAAKGTAALDADVNSLQAMMDAGESAKIYEYAPETYTGIENEVSGSTGLVFIKRTGSEGMDKRTEAYDDGTPHYLALTQNEKDTIKYAKENCGKVIVILNSANQMELSPAMSGEYEADAILWVGTTGSRGFESMGKILCGEVNPSGRLADIYPSDFTEDPTFANMGDNQYTNSTVKDTSTLNFIPGANKGTMQRRFVEYEEGVYVGYRYYETADLMDDTFVYGELDEKGGVVTAGAVAYPFGYGLSYTEFSQEITDFQTGGDDIAVSVKVTNTGDTAGKEVVQVYYTAPYTEYDAENKVEKPATVLGGFAKTDIIDPGASQTVTVSFAKEDMASYDDTHVNEDGTTGCYLLEAGEYKIELKQDSHTVIASERLSVPDTIFYQGENARNSEKNAQSGLDDEGNPLEYTSDKEGMTAASNQFESMNTYMNDDSVTNLTRSDWTHTFPTVPENNEAEAPQSALEEFAANDIGAFDVEKDPNMGNTEGSKVYTKEEILSGEEGGLSLIDMRGLSYDDELWEKLLDQIDWDKEKEAIQILLYNAAYQTGAIESVSKPATTDKDGAMGWSVEGASSWTSANLMACTWNKDLAYEFGLCIGEEALQAGLTGWYAPAMNTHRSQFGGRIYEYYSEDGVLAGKLSAAIVSGAGDKGVISYIKHFALNEQETYRSISLATWANEQTVREIYLKPFEICIKEARNEINYISDDEGTVSTKVTRAATGVMSAQNCIGGTIGFAHYGLLTEVLRNEWGFEGAVITDLYPSDSETLRDMVIRAGGDMYMNQTGYYASDYDSTTARNAMRKAMHNILYMTANSNAVNGMAPGLTFYYDKSPWQIALIAGDIAVAVIIALIIFWIVMRKKDELKYPEKYAKKGEKRARIQIEE